MLPVDKHKFIKKNQSNDKAMLHCGAQKEIRKAALP